MVEKSPAPVVAAFALYSLWFAIVQKRRQP